MADNETADETTALPATHPETGVAMHGDYPLNSLLRATALSAAGVDSDPDGLVTDEHIVAAGKRAAKLEKAEEAADASIPSLAWKRDDLVAEAARIQADKGLDEPLHESDANKPTILAAIQAHSAATEV